MTVPESFMEEIRAIADGLREAAATHSHLNGAAARIDHLGRKLHGFGCVRDREIAECFRVAIDELRASHGVPEERRAEAVRRAVGRLDEALAHAGEGTVS